MNWATLIHFLSEIANGVLTHIETHAAKKVPGIPLHDVTVNGLPRGKRNLNGSSPAVYPRCFACRSID
jgi:hypothetical protein